jgi:hypothetical protein
VVRIEGGVVRIEGNVVRIEGDVVKKRDLTVKTLKMVVKNKQFMDVRDKIKFMSPDPVSFDVEGGTIHYGLHGRIRFIVWSRQTRFIICWFISF